MKKARVYVDGIPAGELLETERGKNYKFTYFSEYKGSPVSLTMPIKQQVYSYDRFPPFFEGLLPEGIMLEGLLKNRKIDRNDLLGQLIAVGEDLVGNVTVEAIE